VSDSTERNGEPLIWWAVPQAPRAKILVAEDDASVCQLLEVILGAHYDVSIVHDGLAALEFVKEHTPNLIVLDVGMPHMDGLEVCSRIRRINRFLNTGIIILTADQDYRTKDSARLYGADLFVEKPLHARRLLNHVAQVLEKYEQRQEEQQVNGKS
jgi:DNA-binding response OmpR family regulator